VTFQPKETVVGAPVVRRAGTGTHTVLTDSGLDQEFNEWS
jgi:hypothetical protein